MRPRRDHNRSPLYDMTTPIPPSRDNVGLPGFAKFFKEGRCKYRNIAVPPHAAWRVANTASACVGAHAVGVCGRSYVKSTKCQ